MKDVLITKQADMRKILVAGDAMLDCYHFGKVDRISPEAPVPVFLEIGKEKYAAGGAANVAVNIAAIGIETEFCSLIGADAHGKRLMECLYQGGVGTEGVAVSSKRGTSVKLRYVGPGNQQILRVDEEQTEDIPCLLIEKIIGNIEEKISDYGVFVLSDYQKGFLTEEITQKLISIAVEHGIPVLVDVKDARFEKYRGAFLLKPNRRELGILTGKMTDTRDDVVNASVWLCRQTVCRYVLATLGSEGMILTDADGLIREVRSTASEVYDVTGAGDTSMAYLAAGLVSGKSIEDAMIIANYAAGVQVSKVGTSIVYPDEVNTMIINERKVQPKKELNFYRKNGLSVLKSIKASGKKIVFTNGCFDIIHAGHISYLKESKRLGDILVVGVNSDSSVKRLKGDSRPVNTLSDRIVVLAALEFVDYVIPFEEDTPKALIAEIMPDVLVKGSDYRAEDIVGADLVVHNGGQVRVLPLAEGRSTTAILNRLQEG